MREIKFRAWLSDGEEGGIYFDPAIVVVGPDYAICDGDEYSISGNPGDCVSLEQYTGLHDKKGREIYEGDFILIGAVITQVKYREEIAAFELMGNRGPIVLSNKYSGEYEVIGNIHENPELLNA